MKNYAEFCAAYDKVIRMKRKKWKSVVSWMLILAMLGGYGNTALAAGLNGVPAANTGTEEGAENPGDAQPAAGTGGEGSDSTDNTEHKDTGAAGGGTPATGSDAAENSQDSADPAAGQEDPNLSEETDAIAAQAATPADAAPGKEYSPYWTDPNFSNLVVFVDFADTSHNHQESIFGSCYQADTAPTFQYFNGDGTYPRGMRQYLYNISYGKLRVENIFPQYDEAEDAIIPYKLSGTAADYAANETAMITEIIGKLNESGQITEGMNLHLGNSSQILDNLMIVVPCDDGNETRLFTGHKANYAGTDAVAGNLVRDYTIVTEGGIYFGNLKSGLIIHEFLHTLGYPDLYRGTVEANQQKGMPAALWDIMATSDHRVRYPLAYLRSAYTEWFDISTIRESQQGLSLYAASAATEETKDRQAFLLKTDYSDTEFFVVEYRKKGTGDSEYDAGIPGSGLIVYRVNTSYRTNYSGPPDHIYIFRPNDTCREDGNEEAGGDIFDSFLSLESGRTSYGSSDPGASVSDGAITYSDGTNSGIVISNVGSAAGDQITFDITFTEEDGYWKTVAREESSDTSYAASCMDEDGTLYYLLQKGKNVFLYQCRDGVFTRLGNAPAGDVHCLEMYDGVLYASWLQDWYVKLAKWNGSSWEELYTSPYQANEFSMTSDTEGVYLAYPNTDGTRVYALRCTGAGVQSLGAQVGESTGYAANVSVAAENGSIAVMYREAFNSGRVCVKQYQSASNTWSNAGSQNFTANSGRITIHNGRIYLMKNGVSWGQNEAYLYRYDLNKKDAEWEQIGENTYADTSITDMDLCFAGGDPYVVYQSGSQPRLTEVKHLVDGQWTKLGESVAKEDITGLRMYSFEDQIYVTYLNILSRQALVKAHASESTGTEELPDPLAYETVEVKNPFQALVERDWEVSDSSLFSQKAYGESFGEQVEGALAKDLYRKLVETYVTGKKTGNQTVALDSPFTFQGTVSNGQLIKDEAYKEAAAQLSSSLQVAYSAFYMDYPSVFWMNGFAMSYSMGGKFTGENTIQVSIDEIDFFPREYYEGASGQVSAYDTAVAEVKGLIESRVSDPEDSYEVVQAIHNYLCETLSYDHAAGNDLGGAGYGYAHTSSTAFLGYNGKKAVVCEGYAKAFKVLCDQFGIPCALVVGQGGTPGRQGPHMWNYVRMEDEGWYGVDVTWDDQESYGTMFDYFLAGSETEGFNGYTFSQEHTEDMNILQGSPAPFVYPVLESEAYEKSKYSGKIVTEADGSRWLVISDMEAGESLSDDRLVSFLQGYTEQAPFAGIRIIRAKDANGALNKTISASVVNTSYDLIQDGGELQFCFWDEGNRELTRWNLKNPEYMPEDKDGTVTAKKNGNEWDLSFSEVDFPAENVEVFYALGEWKNSFGNLLNSSENGIIPVYYYRIGENQEMEWVGGGHLRLYFPGGAFPESDGRDRNRVPP